MRSSLIDFLRILAMGLVLVAHVGQTREAAWAGPLIENGFYIISMGGVGVTLFLMLSGMSLSLSDRPDMTILAFYQKRLLRIYPVYWLALLFSLAITRTVPTDAWDLLLSATGFCAFAGRWGCHLSTSWFIGLIICLYLTFPLLSWAMRRSPWITLFSLLLISTISRLLVPDTLPEHPLNWFPLCRVFEFGVGMFLIKSGAITKALSWTVSGYADHALRYFGMLSFPAFLVHWPLLKIFWRVPSPFSLPIFLVSTFAISAIILEIDRLPAWLRAWSNRRVAMASPRHGL